jgi:hypothetical protein
MTGSGWQRRAVGVLVLGLVFGAGYWIGGQQALHLPTYTADGYVGADQASFLVGGTAYGFESGVAWTDSAGVEHLGSWPDCLPKLHEVKHVRFSGAVLWYGGSGEARVIWVDCQNQGLAQ